MLSSGLGVGVDQGAANVLTLNVSSREPHFECHVIAHVLVIVHVEGPR